MLCFLVSLLVGKYDRDLRFSMLLNWKRKEDFHFAEVNKLAKLSLEESGHLQKNNQVRRQRSLI